MQYRIFSILMKDGGKRKSSYPSKKTKSIEVLGSCLSSGFFHFCFNLLLRAHWEAAEKRSLAGVIFLKALEGVKIATLWCLEVYSCRAKAAVLSSRRHAHLCGFCSEYLLWRAIIHYHLFQYGAFRFFDTFVHDEALSKLTHQWLEILEKGA